MEHTSACISLALGTTIRMGCSVGWTPCGHSYTCPCPCTALASASAQHLHQIRASHAVHRRMAQSRIAGETACRWQRSAGLSSFVNLPARELPAFCPTPRNCNVFRRATMAGAGAHHRESGGEAQAMAQAGGKESERVGGLEQTIRWIQEAVRKLAQGARVKAPAEHKDWSQTAFPTKRCRQSGTMWNRFAISQNQSRLTRWRVPAKSSM